MDRHIDNRFAYAAPTARLLGMVSWCPRWPALLLCLLLIPTEFSLVIGSLRLTPYRIVLLAAFGPCLFRLLSGRAGPIGAADIFLGAHLVWGYVVFAYHHGAAVGVESGGIRMLEAGGAYLVARTWILNERDFRGFIALLGAIFCLLAPLVLFESVTGLHLIKAFSAEVTGNVLYEETESRFGLDRAFGPFDHPIHLGVFAASGLGVLLIQSLPRMGNPQARRLPSVASVLAAFSSLSSGAIAALGAQFLLLMWEKNTRHFPYRWRLLLILIAVLYIAIDILSSRPAIRVFLHYLTFSSHTAYYRTIIFDWGIQEVWRNPIFGIGLNDWIRPEWMHSASMDNLWLVQATTFGIPGFITFILPFIFLLGRGWWRLSPRLTRLRMGWVISMVGLIVAGATVHFWNHLFVYLLLFVGAGAWFLTVERNETDGVAENGGQP